MDRTENVNVASAAASAAVAMSASSSSIKSSTNKLRTSVSHNKSSYNDLSTVTANDNVVNSVNSSAVSSSSSRKRVVSELETAITNNNSNKRDVNDSSLSELRKMIQDEQTNQTSLTDYTALIQTDPTSYQNAVWRERVAQWFYDVLDYLEESRDLAFVAMNIFDRYLAVQTSEYTSSMSGTTVDSTSIPLMMMDHFEYEVLSITSLFLAVRIAGTNKSLTVPEMLELSSSGVQVRHVLCAGNNMLGKVSWDHRIITPHNFLRAFYSRLVQSTSGVMTGGSMTEQAMPKSSSTAATPTQSRSLFDFAAYLIEVSVCDMYFTQVLPSEVAMAALAMALMCDEDMATRYQATFALFLHSAQAETGIDVDSPRMKSILSRMLDVYNQSQEAVVAGGSNIVDGSHDIRDENDIQLDANLIRSDRADNLSQETHIILEDDDTITRPIVIPEDLAADVSTITPTSIRTVTPLFIPSSTNLSDDNAPARKRARVDEG
jgi:Cyclin, C-terminal domain/Cyclin, N-terminal domain